MITMLLLPTLCARYRWMFIGDILEYLDPVSKHCSYYANTRFRKIGEDDKDSLTGCGRWLVLTRLDIAQHLEIATPLTVDEENL